MDDEHGKDEHGSDDPDLAPYDLYESIANYDFPLFERLLAEGRGGGVNEVYVYHDDSNLQIDGDNIGSRSLPVVMAAVACAWSGDDRYLRRLAEAGADVDAPVADGGTHPDGYEYPDGVTALEAAISDAPFADLAVRTLAELGADLYQTNSEGQTYLDQAIGRKASLAAVALVEAGFDPARSYWYPKLWQARRWLDVVAPAEYAVERGEHGRLRKALGDGLPPDEMEGLTVSLLGTACRNNHPELVRLLLEHGADPNHGGRVSISPLSQVLIGRGDPRIVSDLVAAGADAAAVLEQARGRERLPSLRETVGGREPTVARLRLLLEAGEVPDAAAVRAAVRAGNAWALREMAAFGLDLAKADPTALLFAAVRGTSVHDAEGNRIEGDAAGTARLLLEAGADWRARDAHGRDWRDWRDWAEQHRQGKTLDFVTRFLEEQRT